MKITCSPLIVLAATVALEDNGLQSSKNELGWRIRFHYLIWWAVGVGNVC